MGRGPETLGPRRWNFSPGAKFDPGAPSSSMTFTFYNTKNAKIIKIMQILNNKYMNYSHLTYLYIHSCRDIGQLCFQLIHNPDLAKKSYYLKYSLYQGSVKHW